MKKTIRVKVTNDYINSRNLDLINDFVGERFWCNAVYNDEGLVTDDPKASTVIHLDDELVIECDESNIESVVAFLGRDASELEAEGPMTRDKALIKLRKLQKNKKLKLLTTTQTKSSVICWRHSDSMTSCRSITKSRSGTHKSLDE